MDLCVCTIVIYNKQKISNIFDRHMCNSLVQWTLQDTGCLNIAYIFTIYVVSVDVFVFMTCLGVTSYIFCTEYLIFIKKKTIY